MSIKTRLDGRSKDNKSLQIKDPEGNILVEIKLLDASGSTLDITTKDGLYLEKPSGWCSK